MKKIVLVDGHNLLFRMYFGIPASIRNSKGKEIKSLVGFLGSIKKLANELAPYSLVVIFDSQTSGINNKNLDSNYKANRKNYDNVEEENNPFSQLPLIKKALDYLQIFHLEVAHFEADDYIASLVTKESDQRWQYIVASTDFDFIQLINKSTLLYMPRGKNSVLFDCERVFQKYQITPQQYVQFKSLTGDKSDNIQGVKGIGVKTAAQILSYGSLDQYIEQSANTKLANLLKENREKILKNIELISMNRHIDTSVVQFKKLDDRIFTLKVYEIIKNIGEV